MKILNWLEKPYPFISETKSKFLISFSFGLFVYLFLVIFQPFGIANIIDNKSIYLIGFGLITTFVMLFNYLIIPLLFQRLFDIDKWNIWKGILFATYSITMIAFINYEYHSIVAYTFAEQRGLGYFIPVTISVGIFPITFLMFITELFLNKKHQKTASEISSRIKIERETDKAVSNSIIRILSVSKKEEFELDENDLIFIKSEDNYCKVHYVVNNKMKSKLIRITLKNIEKQLDPFSEMIRCHRSYIVNRRQITRISGNARAYYLHFDICEEKIPISRSFPKEQLL